MKSKSYELKAVTLLAAIIAITSVGQFAIAGMTYYGSPLIHPAVARILLMILFWTAFIFLFVALNMYRKL